MKIPYSVIMIKPFGIIGDNVKNFFKIASIYSAIFCLLAYFMGSTYACMYPEAQTSFFPCYGFGWQVILYQILKIFIAASFIKNWANVVFENKSINLRPQKQDAKILGVLAATIAACILPLISFALLYIRVPNPDWRIEMMYFTVVSVGFWVPFLLLRLLPVIGMAANNEKIVDVKNVWHQTSESGFRVLFFMMTFLILSAFVQLNLMQSFANIQNNFTIVNVLFVDFIYNITTLLLLAIFVNHCIMTKEFIKGDK